MKKFFTKFFILLLGCCFAVFLAACSDKNDGNDSNEEYETGAVFQLCNSDDTATDEKYFDDKDGVKAYIADSFADGYYFCVFGDGETAEIFHNLTAGSDSYSYGAELYLDSGECLTVYDIIYNSSTEKYTVKEGAPYTIDIQASLEFKVGKNENYNIKLNVIPAQPQKEILSLNEPVNKTVKENQTEYFYFTPEISGPYDLTVSGSGDFEVRLDADEQIVGRLMKGPQIEASYYIFDGIEYRLAVHSYGGDSEVNIEFKNAETLELGKEAEYEIGDSKYFVFTPSISSEVIFGTNGEGYFEITLFNDDNKFLAKTTDADSFSCLVEKGQKYFVLVERYSQAEEKVKIYTRLNPVDLKYGSWEQYQPTEENCYLFTPNISAEYTVSLTDNEFKIYDSEWKRVEEVNGKYALEEGCGYFVIITGSVKEFTADIELCYITDTEGVIPDGGYVIVKFVPDVTASYIVEGAENVGWYNLNLIKGGSFLRKGETYFAKISGEAGGNYSICIDLDYTNISVGRLVNLFDGAYKFTVADAGDYSITFYSGNNTVEFNLYNAKGEKLKEYSGGHGEITVNLDVGEYTFDLSVSEATSAGIIINKVII